MHVSITSEAQTAFSLLFVIYVAERGKQDSKSATLDSRQCFRNPRVSFPPEMTCPALTFEEAFSGLASLLAILDQVLQDLHRLNGVLVNLARRDAFLTPSTRNGCQRVETNELSSNRAGKQSVSLWALRAPTNSQSSHQTTPKDLLRQDVRG